MLFSRERNEQGLDVEVYKFTLRDSLKGGIKCGTKGTLEVCLQVATRETAEGRTLAYSWLNERQASGLYRRTYESRYQRHGQMIANMAKARELARSRAIRLGRYWGHSQVRITMES